MELLLVGVEEKQACTPKLKSVKVSVVDGLVGFFPVQVCFGLGLEAESFQCGCELLGVELFEFLGECFVRWVSCWQCK